MSYSDLAEVKAIFKLEHALSCLTVYKNVTESDVIRQLRSFLSGLARPGVAVEDNMVEYTRLLTLVMNADIDGSLSRIIVRRILLTEHALNKLLAEHEAARHPMATSALSEMAAADLDVLQQLAGVSSLQVKKLMNLKAGDQKRSDLSERISRLAVWHNQENTRISHNELHAYGDILDSFVRSVNENGSWSGMLPELFRFHHACGNGILAGYRSLRLTSNGLEPVVESSSLYRPALLDYHGCFTDLREQTEDFARGGYAADTIITGVVGVGKHSIIRDLAERHADDKLNFVYLKTTDSTQVIGLFERLEISPKRSVLVIDNVYPEAETDYDQAYIRTLRQIMSRKSDKVLIYLLHDISRKAMINGKLFDRKVLLSIANTASEALIGSFPSVCHLRLPFEEENKLLLDHLAMSFDVRLRTDQYEEFNRFTEKNGLLNTPAAALNFVRNLLISSI